MKTIYICIVLCIISTIELSAYRAPDSCLKRMYYADGSEYEPNPDSVRIDSCIGSATFGSLYAKKTFDIMFNNYKLMYYGKDTVLNTYYYKTWNDILPQFAAIKSIFAQIDSLFGPYTMIKIMPRAYSDTVESSDIAKSYLLEFDNYVPIDAVIALLANMPDIHTYRYMDRHFKELTMSLTNDRGLKPGTPIKEVYANHTDFYNPLFNKNSFAWHIYSLSLPMAWEITKGKNSVLLGAGDEFVTPSSHPELTENWTRTTNRGDGTGTTLAIRSGHGMTTLSMSIASGDNDQNLSASGTGLGTGMIGSCYKCKGYAIPMSGYDQYDLDNSSNSVFRHFDILNLSYGSRNTNEETLMENTINKGVFVVSTSANDRNRGIWRTTVTQNGLSDTYCSYSLHTYYPAAVFPAAHVFTDPLDATKDYRVLCVGGLQSSNGMSFGPKVSGETNPQTMRTPCTDFKFFTPLGESTNDGTVNLADLYGSEGPEQFVPTWNFSPGKNKFSINTNPATRQTEKEQAFMDVVAPAVRLLAAQQGGSEILNVNTDGTSFAAPTVMGIIGLMYAVHDKAGIPYNGTNGPDIHRRVYDLVTFTTDKIEDFDNIPTQHYRINNACSTRYVYANVNFDQSPIQFDYIVQTNDVLQRSWAQRMGFGKVNAYRAVAHTIDNKANYSYSSSLSLPFTTGAGKINEDNKLLMHMGAWKNSTQKVLEVGGVVFSGEPVWKNNNGKTEINGTNTVLTVPSNCILAQDGIATTQNASGNNKIVTAARANNNESHGLILSTGYLENITLEGLIKTGDLLITSSENGGTGILCKNHAPTESKTDEALLAKNMCEVYGKVSLKNNGYFIVDNDAICRVQPGGILSMEGNKDIEIRAGAFLDLQPSSTIISADASRKIIVKNGGTLRVRSNTYASADIECAVLVEDGGTLLLEEDAFLRINRFIVDIGGTVECKPGSRLAIQSTYPNGKNECNGKLIANGTAAKRIRITSKTTNPCDANPNRNNIFMVGNPAQSTKSQLTLSYVDIDHVKISANNIRMTGPIQDCNFMTNRCVALQDISWGVSPFRLGIQYSMPSVLTDDERKVDILHSSFTSPQSMCCPTCTPQTPLSANLFTLLDLNLGGVKVVNASTANFSACSLKNVYFGIVTQNCGVVSVNGNSFETVQTSYYDVSSRPTLCSNTFSDTPYPTVFGGSLGARIMNGNSFLNTDVTVVSDATPLVFMRGNDFTNFRRGVDVRNGIANLAHRPLNVMFSNISEILGRNRFTVANPGIIPYPNKFVTNADFPNFCDIWIENNASDLWLNCGYNAMAEYTAYHINGNAAPVPPRTLRNGDFNDYRSPALIPSALRLHPNFVMPAITTHLSHQIAEHCALVTSAVCPTCAPLADVPGGSASPGIRRADNGTVTNSKEGSHQESLLSEQTSESVHTISEAMVALYEKNPTLSGGDLLTALLALNRDNAAVARSTAYMLTALRYENHGNAPMALGLYRTVAANPATSSDSMVVSWHIHRLALELDMKELLPEPQYSEEKYWQKVAKDIIRSRRGSYNNAVPTPSLLTGINNLVSDDFTHIDPSMPHPFNGETLIPFTLAHECHITLSIIDSKGMPLFDLYKGIKEKGKHSIKFDGSALPSGLYHCRLECNDKQWIIPLLIVH